MLENNYKQKLRVNAFSTTILQLATALIGIVVPKIMITVYGSATNGLVASISQFLGYISLLEAGVGGVIKASLYTPVVEKDTEKISRVVNSSSKFFKKIARIFLLYICFLAIAYPMLIKNTTFSREYIWLMIFILGSETFIRYYFSLPYQILLQASQRIFVVNYLQTVLAIVNAICTIFLALWGFKIHAVKFVTMLVFLVRPLFLILYTRKFFKIDKSIGYDDNALSQRWDGFGQHIGFFIHKNTDVAVLTFFASLSEISVYGIYVAVVNAVQTVVLSFANSVSAVMGTLYALKDKEKLKKVFAQYESFVFISSTIFFSITSVMIVPFVSIYTKNITDVSYVRPFFSFILIMSEFVYVIRSPYSSLILSAGFYRETRNGAYVEAGLNLIISLLLIHKYGLDGVVLGTLVAMSYRTFEFVTFLKHNILFREYRHFVRNMIVSLVSFSLTYVLCDRFILNMFSTANWFQWIFVASVVSIASMLIVLTMNFTFNKRGLLDAIKLFSKKN